MAIDDYQLKFLSTFEEDITRTVDYIALTICNPDAADKLVDDTYKAIYERLKNPTAFEIWNSPKDREQDYYRIYVRNYTVFYVVYDDVMEVRRFLYTPSNWKRKI